MEVAERSDGSLQGLRDVYGLIQEKGFFWAFDQIVESGQIPYEEIMKCRVLERKSVKFIELHAEIEFPELEKRTIPGSLRKEMLLLPEDGARNKSMLQPISGQLDDVGLEIGLQDLFL
ncbi:hypothetical protein LWI29_001664 [Acer saccharum]|uniref:Uncharacterized protein n=1 Tax=Acer saccharum TaxID=4024 RepID=A0AA39W8S7_ACESA|nr:hypothetical protein LWI29_001664 [Acer saccharum]